MNNYQIYEEIGRGKHSIVYKGRRKKTLKYYAVKSIDKAYQSKVLNEVKILHNLEHPNVLRFFNWYETTNHIWVIVDYCTGGSLLSLLKADGQLKDERVIETMAADLVSALHYIHSLSIVYCDLKPSNILLDGSSLLKLCDFGNAQRFVPPPKGKPEAAKRGTPCYMAPELFTEDGVHSTYSDFWSLGCVLYELATGKPPFYHQDFEQLAEMILNKPVPAVSGFSDEFNDLLQGLLQKNPTSRWSWEELIGHSFWKRYDFTHFETPPPFPHFEDYVVKSGVEDLRGQRKLSAATTDFESMSVELSSRGAGIPGVDVTPEQKRTAGGRRLDGTDSSSHSGEVDVKRMSWNISRNRQIEAVVNSDTQMAEAGTKSSAAPSSTKPAADNRTAADRSNTSMSNASTAAAASSSAAVSTVVEDDSVPTSVGGKDSVRHAYTHTDATAAAALVSPDDEVDFGDRALDDPMDTETVDEDETLTESSEETEEPEAEEVETEEVAAGVEDEESEQSRHTRAKSAAGVLERRTKTPGTGVRRVVIPDPAAKKPPRTAGAIQTRPHRVHTDPNARPHTAFDSAGGPTPAQPGVSTPVPRQSSSSTPGVGVSPSSSAASGVPVSTPRGGGMEAEVRDELLAAIGAVLPHSSDTQVKPVVLNPRIESLHSALSQARFDAHLLPFPAYSHQDFLKFTSHEVQTFVATCGRVLDANAGAGERERDVGDRVQSAGAGGGSGGVGGPLAERMNLLSYLEKMCCEAAVANLLVTTSDLLTRLIRALSLVVVAPMRIRLCSVISILLRFATELSPEIIESTSLVQNLVDLMSDRQVKVRRRAIAVFAELCFYIATQTDEAVEGGDAEGEGERESERERVRARWAIPPAALSIVSRALRSSEDSVVQMSAARLIENVAAYKCRLCRDLCTPEIVAALLALYPNAAKDSLKASLLSAAGRLSAHDATLAQKFLGARGTDLRLLNGALNDSNGRVQLYGLNLLCYALLAGPSRALISAVVDDRALLASLIRLLGHSVIIMRGKTLLAFALLFASSQRALLAACERKFCSSYERLVREAGRATSSYLSRCMQQLTATIRQVVLPFLAACAEDIRSLEQRYRLQTGAKTTAAVQQKQLRDRVALFPIVLHILSSPSLLPDVATAECLVHISDCIRNIELLAPPAAFADFTSNLLLSAEAITQARRVLDDRYSTVVHSLLPALASLLDSPSGDRRFTGLKVFADIVIYYLHGGTHYAPEQSGNVPDTRALNEFLVKHVVPRMPAILDDEGPIPLYGLKLLSNVLERNIGFAVLLGRLGIVDLFLTFFELQHRNNNIHNVKLVLKLLQKHDVIDIWALTGRHNVCEKLQTVLTYAYENKVDGFLEPCMEISIVLLHYIEDAVRGTLPDIPLRPRTSSATDPTGPPSSAGSTASVLSTGSGNGSSSGGVAEKPTGDAAIERFVGLCDLILLAIELLLNDELDHSAREKAAEFVYMCVRVYAPSRASDALQHALSSGSVVGLLERLFVPSGLMRSSLRLSTTGSLSTPASHHPTASANLRISTATLSGDIDEDQQAIEAWILRALHFLVAKCGKSMQTFVHQMRGSNGLVRGLDRRRARYEDAEVVACIGGILAALTPKTLY